jgi:acetolactate synthase I/III small subunit
VYNVLDASYSPTSHHHVFEACTLSIDVQDVPGVLNQVTGVVSRRSYNVQSLAVGNSEKEGMSRITMVVPGEADAIEKLKKQLLKLVYVHSVTELHAVPHVARELMLVKVACSPGQRGEILDLARIFHGSVCDVSRSTVTLEVTGKEDKMRALQDVLEPYGILEIARTGRVALERESGVDSRYLSNIAGARVML